MANDQGISVSPDTLRSKKAEIDAIDEWLEAVSGGSSAGKVALRNQLAKDDEVTKASDKMIGQIEKFLSEQTPEVRAGLF